MRVCTLREHVHTCRRACAHVQTRIRAALDRATLWSSPHRPRSRDSPVPGLTVRIVRIFYASHSAPSENHLILCQSASFIREDILDLPQVLRDVQSPALQLGVGLLIVQLQVLVDEVHLAHFNDLDGDVERNGDQDLEDTRHTE